MNKVIDKLIEDYKLKGYNLKVVSETEKGITFNLESNINGKNFTEDLEILKSFITFDHYDFIKNSFNYLIHNSLDRFLGGE